MYAATTVFVVVVVDCCYDDDDVDENLKPLILALCPLPFLCPV